jgi:SHS family lactate transporter-like MFS transporter
MVAEPERFPTEVRTTAAGFCYHQGAIFGGSPVVHLVLIVASAMGPETKGRELLADLHEPAIG